MNLNKKLCLSILMKRAYLSICIDQDGGSAEVIDVSRTSMQEIVEKTSNRHLASFIKAYRKTFKVTPDNSEKKKNRSI
jgi:hypothetical protein